MTDRERLIELLSEYDFDAIFCNICERPFDDCAVCGCERLADYLIEHAVIVPPCKVGDTIYQTDGVRIYTSTIYEITYTANKVIFVTENVVFDERAINNSIFLTREEAEKALKERESNA